MPSYEELVAAEQAIREVLAGGVEAQLRALPGVVHVSVGLKESAGAVTQRGAIRVYVREKLPADALPPADRVPREIAGIPTDVLVPDTFGFAVDNAQYRPVVGGVQITNRIIDNVPQDDNDLDTQGIFRGTLGCIATDNRDHSIVLLTNWHVLTANHGGNGDRIYQPGPTVVTPVSLADLPMRPRDDTNVIARTTRTVITDKVDGGIARLDLSSCCRCCGLDYRDQVNGLAGAVPGMTGLHPPSSFLVGMRPATMGMPVVKVGQKTGRTVGQVVDPGFSTPPGHPIPLGGTNYAFTGQIQIASTVPGRPFFASGDSGAVIVDTQGYIVGLGFASNRQPTPNDRALANHISDVCSQLEITINLTPPSHTSGARIFVPAAIVPEPGAGPAAYRAVRERLTRDPAGAWLLELAEEHRVEIVELVTGRRPVTVAWRRAHGPAFLAAALNTLRAGGETLPGPVEGTTLYAALERIGAALAAHGSPWLREAIAEWRPVLLEAVRGSATLDEVLGKLDTALYARPWTET